MVDIQSPTAEIRRGKKRRRRRRNRMKIYMVSLFHRATINKMESAANWENFFRSSLRLLQHFSYRSFPYDADNRWLRNACLLWYFRDCVMSSRPVLLTQNHIVYLVNVFICAGTSQSVAAMTSMHCSHVSEHLEQPANATCRPSFVRKFCPQLLRP